MTVLEISGEQPKRRSKSNGHARPVLVAAGTLAAHLDCHRSYVGKLTDARVLERDASGKYDLDRNRLLYIRHLRELRKASPRSAADAAFTVAKTRLIELRLQEKEGSLIPVADAVDRMEKMMGTFLTFTSGFPARIAGADREVRRRAEQAVFDLRTQVAEQFQRFADAENEPAEQEVA